MRRISAERTREIQALLGPGFTLHDENAGHFLEALRRASATLRRRNIIQMANRFQGPSQDGRTMQLMEACYRFSSRHYAFFIWQTTACVGNQKWNFPQFSIKPRGFWSRLGLGGRGIRFEAHPRFSARFKVECPMKRAHAVFSFRCCSKNSSDFPTWWSKVAAVISSSFVREKSSRPPRFPRFQDEVRTLARLFPGEMQIP
jgi:hypothetical protein